MTNKIIMGIGAMVILAFCGWVYANGGVLPNGTRAVPNLMGGNTVTTNYGKVQTGAGASYPAEWPSDAPRYSGGTVITSLSPSAQSPIESYMVQFTTRDSGDTIINFYKNALTQNGWEGVGAMQAGGTKIVLGTKNGSKRVFNVGVTESNGEATVIVSVGSLPVTTPL